MFTIVHFFRNLLLHISLAFGGIIDVEKFLGDGEEVFNMFAIDDYLTTRSDGVVDRGSSGVVEESNIKTGADQRFQSSTKDDPWQTRWKEYLVLKYLFIVREILQAQSLFALKTRKRASIIVAITWGIKLLIS